MRIECGPRDLENNQVMTKMRDLDEKVAVGFDVLLETIQAELEKMQGRLLDTARAMRASNEYTTIDTLEELKAHIEAKREAGEVPGWVLVGWDGTEETEAKIKEETGFTTRNIPFNPPVKKETCIVSGKPATQTVWIARAY